MIPIALRRSSAVSKTDTTEGNRRQKQLRVFFYNHSLGVPSGKLVSSARLHASLFFRKNYSHIRKTSITPTIALVKESAPDIVAIAEVLGRKQRLALIASLRRLGFRSFHPGFGIRCKEGDHAEILLATRQKSVVVPVPSVDHSPNLPGCGGGIAAAMIGRQEILVIALHAALRRTARTTRIWHRQMKVIEGLVRARHGKPVILLGDFNLAPKDFSPFLHSLDRYSTLAPTCSTTPLIRLLYRRPIDHILGLGFNVIHSSVKRGQSDHRAVLAHLVPDC